MPLLGLSLIERVILSAREAGIEEFVVVLGYQGKLLSEKLGEGKNYGINLHYVYNYQYSLGNGTSVLAAKKVLENEERFLLLMADHIVDPEVLKEFLFQKDKGDSLLLVDKDLERVWDLEEATKVWVEDSYIRDIGKKIPRYNGVDCGIFLCTPLIFLALENSRARGEYSLNAGIKELAKQRKLKIYPIKEAFWVDVDTWEALKFTRKKLLKSLISDRDGMVSRILNRRISTQITRFLVRTKLTPDQVSFLSLITGLFSAFSFGLAFPVFGGVLAQLSSVLDGVDGEIARLKFLRSKYGAFLEAMLDRYVDALIILGITYASYQALPKLEVWILGFFALMGAPFSMLAKEKYEALTGKPYLPYKYDGWFRYLPAGRDGRLFLIMIGGILKQLVATLAVIAVVTQVLTIYRLYSVRKLLKE